MRILNRMAIVMKKHTVLSLILVLVLTVGMLSFVSCGKQQTPDPSTGAPDVSDTAADSSTDAATAPVTDAVTESTATVTDATVAPADEHPDKLFDRFVSALEKGAAGELKAVMNPVFTDLVEKGKSADYFGASRYIIYDNASVDEFFAGFNKSLADNGVADFRLSYEFENGETFDLTTEQGRKDAFDDVLMDFPDYQIPDIQKLHSANIKLTIYAGTDTVGDPVEVGMATVLDDSGWKIGLLFFDMEG